MVIVFNSLKISTKAEKDDTREIHAICAMGKINEPTGVQALTKKEQKVQEEIVQVQAERKAKLQQRKAKQEAEELKKKKKQERNENSST